MTRRAIEGRTFEKTPAVRITKVEGSKFTGKLLGSRETKFGLSFKLSVIDGDAPIQINAANKGEKANWVDVDVAVGDPVELLTSKDGQLETKLKQIKVGETVEVTYKGKVLNQKTGRQFGDFDVFVIE